MPVLPYMGLLRFIALSFIALHKHCVFCGFVCFLKIEGLRQACTEQVYWHRVSNSICPLCVSMSHYNSCKISNFFIIIIFIMVIHVQ